MTTLPFLLLLSLAQQPAQQRPQPAASPATAQATNPPPPDPARRAGFDSTVQAIRDVGAKVATVKSRLDQFRRAAFNEANGTFVERSDSLRSACRALAEASDRATRRICRGCMPPTGQDPVDAYRAYLPTLASASRRCVTRISQLRGTGTANDSMAARIRREVRPIQSQMVDALRPYEARLANVRAAFGGSPPAPAARN